MSTRAPGGEPGRLIARLFACASLLMMGAAVVACGPPAKAPTVSLRVAGEPPQARVIIDEVYIGSLAFVSSRGVALPVGSHRITVEAPGFFPQDQIVTVEDGDAPVKLEIHLTRVPD